jgi:ABC-type bacteriocin/lantibiotic exporter with double-glycine peptidase domain
MNIKMVSRVLKLFSPSEKRMLIIILLVTIISSCIQALGVASIMPFIALISEPEITQNHPTIIAITEWLDITDTFQILLIAGIFAFIVFAFGNILATLDTWLSVRFFYKKDYQLSTYFLNNYLSKTWPDFQKKNRSEMKKTILSDIDRIIENSFLSFTSLISDIIVTLFIFFLLLWVNVYTTIFTVFFLGLTYWLIYTLISEKVDTLGRQFTQLETDIFQSLDQALKFYKESKLNAKESYFLKKFTTPLKTSTQNAIKYATLSIIPVQLVELLAFGLIIAIALYFYSAQNTDVVSTIAIYAFAAYKLIPLLKSIFESLESLKFSSSVLSDILDEVENSEIIKTPATFKKINLKRSIDLHNINFRYSANLPWVLRDYQISIPAGKMTVIKGRSGIGKSTSMDILLGLQIPQIGHIEVDSIRIEPALIPAWQNTISFVPQDVQLLDDTIAANIAFGEESTNIDKQKLQQAITFAELESVINSFPDKELTKIGADGIALSGGQKQRIGLARCLYEGKNILFLDEFTNELDNETEQNILSNLKALNNTTIVCITHKASVIEAADHVIEIK